MLVNCGATVDLKEVLEPQPHQVGRRSGERFIIYKLLKSALPSRSGLEQWIECDMG